MTTTTRTRARTNGTTIIPETIPNPLKKLRADLRRGAVTLTTGEVRFLVDIYYNIQDYRIQAGGQIRQSGHEPHEYITDFFDLMEQHEREIQGALYAYTDTQ